MLPESENAEEAWQKSCCKKVETQYTAWNAFIFNERFNSFYQWVSTTKNGWTENQLTLSVVKLTKKFALEEPTPIIDQMCIECTQHESIINESVDKISCYLFATTKYCHGSTAQGQTLGTWESYILALRHEGPCGKCGDRCCESAQIRGTVIKHVHILHWWSSNYERWFRIVGEVAECMCSNGVKMLIRTRPDILCTVNALVRVVTKWNRACAKPLPRLKSFLQMHFGTSTILSCWRQSQWMQARSVPRPPCCWIIGRFKVNIWCNGLYIWWSYICTNVRNKRQCCCAALNLKWYHKVLGFCDWRVRTSCRAQCDPSRLLKSQNSQTTKNHWSRSTKRTRVQQSCLYMFICEDNEVVMKMVIKGRRPHVRFVSRRHRVNLDGLFGRVNLESNISVKCVYTNQQIADYFNERFFHTLQVGWADDFVWCGFWIFPSLLNICRSLFQYACACRVETKPCASHV